MREEGGVLGRARDDEEELSKVGRTQNGITKIPHDFSILVRYLIRPTKIDVNSATCIICYEAV